MKQKITQFICLLTIGIFICACDSLEMADKASAVSSAPALQNYLDAYKKLRNEAPNVLKRINSGESSVSDMGEEYQQYENIISAAGYSGHSDFVKNNAKVGMVYSILRALMKQEVHDANMKNMDDLAEFIQSSIDDPDVPEEKKAELRQQLKEVSKGKQSLNRMDQSIIWAKGVVKMAKRLENMSISESEAMLLIKHEKEIQEAYEGFPMPPAVNIPHVDVDDLE